MTSAELEKATDMDKVLDQNTTKPKSDTKPEMVGGVSDELQHEVASDLEHRLALPKKTQPIRVNWTYSFGLLAIHLLALLAVIPYFFSWTGLVLAIAGHFFFGMLGVTIGYHRLLTHRGFECPMWLEKTFAILGICNFQESPARWVAIHRMHHQHSDHQPDPHSPLVNFLWSHVGWLLVRNRDHSELMGFERYARDLLRNPFYLGLERYHMWFFVFIAHAIVFYLVGLLGGWAYSGNLATGVQFGSSLLVWGVFVRTVFVLHGTWAVNSVTHVWGYQNYKTRDNSRNNWLVALFSHGEGWHNNHHAQPRAAAHGHKWWEYDMSYGVIRLMERVGLARNVVRPK